MKGFNIDNNRGKVYQYDLDGNFIREFKHCVDAIEILKCTSDLYYHLEKSYPKTIQGHVFSRTYYIKYPSEFLPEKTRMNSNRLAPIFQYDKNGNLIKEWDCNSRVIAEELKISNGNLVSCLTGHRKTAGGFIWKHKQYDELPQDVLDHHKINYTARKKRTGKPINQYDLDGNFIKEYSSIVEANKIVKVDRGNISHCLSGKYKKAGGFIWKYKE